MCRNYFYECNFRTSRGCQAKKLVQRTEDKPPMYQTTYMNHHTCNNRLKALPGVIFDSTTLMDSISIKSAFKCPDDILKEPSYPTSTKTHHPPVIISSYRTWRRFIHLCPLSRPVSSSCPDHWRCMSTSVQLLLYLFLYVFSPFQLTECSVI